MINKCFLNVDDAMNGAIFHLKIAERKKDLAHLEIAIMKASEMVEQMHFLAAQRCFQKQLYQDSLEHLKLCVNSDEVYIWEPALKLKKLVKSAIRESSSAEQ
jgi:hypothetical protein